LTGAEAKPPKEKQSKKMRKAGPKKVGQVSSEERMQEARGLVFQPVEEVVKKEEKPKEEASKGKKKGIWPWSKLRQDDYDSL
jgi:succinyl-CoA synthetase alpha subunit